MATEDDNLTITCDLVHNGDVYQVSIEKLDAEVGSSNIIATCQMLDDGVKLSEFNSRGQLNCSDALEVSLHLTNIVKEDGGLYRCNFSTDAGVQSTTILLTTLPAQGRTGVELAVSLQQRRPNCSLQGPKIIMHGILSAAIFPLLWSDMVGRIKGHHGPTLARRSWFVHLWFACSFVHISPNNWGGELK